MALKRAGVFILAIADVLATSYAQHPAPAPQPASTAIHLNVAVTSKSGSLVSDLTQQDFTLLDNKQPRPITSFKIVQAAQEPVEVILLLDAVNANYQTVAYARLGMEKFFRSNEGKLRYPTTFAVLGDKGAQIYGGFTKDGNASSDALEKFPMSLREIHRGSEWGGYDQLQISLTAMQQLIAYASTLPGRKIVLWVSPGWPLLSGPRVDLDTKQENQFFDQIVGFSTQMRLANVTLYDTNPLGGNESIMLQDGYEAYLNGVSKPSQVMPGNIALQVLATESGGLSIQGNSDIAEMIERSLADAESWYEIEFEAPPPDKPNAYHRLEIKIDKPGLTARTRANYYSKPTPTVTH